MTSIATRFARTCFVHPNRTSIVFGFVQGFDCSGLVQYAFKTQSDLDLPRTSRALSRLDAPSVKRSDLQPGDLLFFRIRSRSVDHVAIYLGDGRFIHAPRRGSNVRIDHLSNAYWQRHFQLAKRVVPEA